MHLFCPFLFYFAYYVYAAYLKERGEEMCLFCNCWQMCKSIPTEFSLNKMKIALVVECMAQPLFWLWKFSQSFKNFAKEIQRHNKFLQRKCILIFLEILQLNQEDAHFDLCHVKLDFKGIKGAQRVSNLFRKVPNLTSVVSNLVWKLCINKTLCWDSNAPAKTPAEQRVWDWRWAQKIGKAPF